MPEFFYKECYDEKHRIFPRSAGKVCGPPIQKGLRERLLCGGCETHLSAYEKYGSCILYGGSAVTAKRTPQGLVLSGLDFTKMRVFLLSILWRMSVASDRMWSAVALGPHEEEIRQLVLNGDAGSADDYPVICIAPLFDGNFLHDFILEPDAIRAYRGRFYRVVLGGFLFFFYVSAVDLNDSQDKKALQEDGTWFIPFEDAMKIKFLNADVRSIVGK